MSLQYKILGEPFMDNAMYVKVDTGQKNYHLLFDLGYACLESIDIASIMDIDHVFLSHLHVDHIAGFDFFFRFNYNRDSKPLHFWVPENCAHTLHNKFLGFSWNLIGEDTPGIFYIHEIKADAVLTFEIKAAQRYEKLTLVNEKANDGLLIDNEDFEVRGIVLNHGIPSIGYFVKEKIRFNISKEKLVEFNFNPGPWLGKLKSATAKETDMVVVNDEQYSIKQLKEMLYVASEGQNIAYLTDFWVDDNEITRIAQFISGCHTFICETQYNNEDIELADKNMHMTAGKAGMLAKDAEVDEMIIFHVSTRYDEENVNTLLQDARCAFTNSTFPLGWFDK